MFASSSSTKSLLNAFTTCVYIWKIAFMATVSWNKSHETLKPIREYSVWEEPKKYFVSAGEKHVFFCAVSSIHNTESATLTVKQENTPSLLCCKAGLIIFTVKIE